MPGTRLFLCPANNRQSSQGKLICYFFNVRCNADNVWALTFDDGPTDGPTFRVLASLQKAKVKATFFVVGSRVISNPTVLKAVYDAGHEIGIHTWSYGNNISLT